MKEGTGGVRFLLFTLLNLMDEINFGCYKTALSEIFVSSDELKNLNARGIFVYNGLRAN